MALPAWQATIVTGGETDGGDIIPSPVITVIVESTGLPAVLFSNRAGTTPLGTSGVFTGGVDGFVQFFAAPDLYRVKASDAGSGFERTWDFVVLSGTMATVEKQTSPTDATAGRGLTTDSTHTAAGVIYTGVNYQPEISLGRGVPRLMRNKSGGTHTDGQTGIAGSDLLMLFINSTLGINQNNTGFSGTWTCVQGHSLGDDDGGYYVRVS